VEAAPWLVGEPGEAVPPGELYDKLKPFEQKVAEDIEQAAGPGTRPGRPRARHAHPGRERRAVAPLLPLFAPLAVLSPLTGRLVARRGPRPAMILGATLAAAGMPGLLSVTPAAPYPRVLPALAVLGAGIGTFIVPIVAAAIRALPPERSGLASSINNTARQAGTALGVTVFGAIAGSPAIPQHFVTALRVLGGISAVLWLLAIVMTVVGIRRLGSLLPGVRPRAAAPGGKSSAC
jgi:MFS family permease